MVTVTEATNIHLEAVKAAIEQIRASPYLVILDPLQYKARQHRYRQTLTIINMIRPKKRHRKREFHYSRAKQMFA